MKKLLSLLLLLSLVGHGQTIFQVQDVEKPATPQGGFPYLQQFVIDNLQIPFQARLQHHKGRVFVSGVVETDGRVSDLKIVKGISPLCDAEALRVLGVFQAWEPALKDNKPVRQEFNFSVVFPDAPVANYDSTTKSVVDYFNKQFQPTQDSSDYRFRQITPVDEKGEVRDNIVFEELKRKEWKPMSVVKVKRKEAMYHVYNEPSKVDSVQAYSITAMDENFIHYIPERIFQKNGLLLEQIEYGRGAERLNSKEYYLNGAIKEQFNTLERSNVSIRWYDNGQIAEVIEKELYDLNKPDKILKEKILSVWSRTGKQLVKNGNGWAAEGISLRTHGLVQDGLRVGRWTAKLPDSTLYMDEMYEEGLLKLGTINDKGEVRTYTEAEKNAEFKGGLSELGIFLARNIQYPTEASRRRISGKVYLSFVVCEDGSLCDYQILKGIGGGCDEEALRVVKQMSGKWKPGLRYGKKVRVKYNLPVSFVLN